MTEDNLLKIGIYMENVVTALEIEMMLYGYFGKKGEPISTRIVTSGDELSNTLSWYDILFYQLDNLGDDYRKHLRYIFRLNNRVVAIFATRVFEDDFLEERSHPGIFLWRPMTKEDLGVVLEESLNKVKESVPEKYLFCETQDGRIRVPYTDILYLESYYRKVYLHLAAGRTYTINGALADIADILSKDRRFLKIHQSYLVNLQHVVRATYEKVELGNGKELNISAANRPYTRRMIEEYLG